MSEKTALDHAVRTVVPGMTVVVLENGDCVCGQLIPRHVTKLEGQKDPHGRQAYQVEWDIGTGTVPNTGLPERGG